jgi:hypothetical protein
MTPLWQAVQERPRQRALVRLLQSGRTQQLTPQWQVTAMLMAHLQQGQRWVMVWLYEQEHVTTQERVAVGVPE